MLHDDPAPKKAARRRIPPAQVRTLGDAEQGDRVVVDDEEWFVRFRLGPVVNVSRTREGKLVPMAAATVCEVRGG